MDTSKQAGVTTIAEVAAAEVEASDKRSRPSASEKFAPSEKQRLDQIKQVATEGVSPARARTGGGPRTTQGKQKCKLNALKHGIFSQVVLLEGKPRAEFNSLLCKLRDDLEPEGALEEVLVDKLAVLLWRQRRLIIAEGAEIRKGTEFLEWDEKRQRDDEEANITVCDVKYCGLVRKIANPKVLDRCLNLLDKLDEEIEMYGFEEEENKIILGQLYGDPESKLWVERTLFDAYSDLLNLARFNPSSGEQSKVLSPEHCKNIFLHCLKEEIKRLDRYKREHALTESHRMKVESLRGNVPDAPQVDRLLRCETNLGRRFDRTLSQLERLQRMRKGQS